MSITDQMALPYPESGGETWTGGWSGSETSHERALREAEDGTLHERQRKVVRMLGLAKARGATWREVGSYYDWHHGQSSGALSDMHKAGLIARLKGDRRNRCAVYVLPEYVNGRETAPHGRRKPEGQITLAQADLEALRASSFEEGYEQGKRAGFHREGEDVLEFVTRMRETVLAGQGPKGHTKTCYTKHPECALLAVQKYLKAGLV